MIGKNFAVLSIFAGRKALTSAGLPKYMGWKVEQNKADASKI
jgi:hypothetical protein